MPVEPYLPGSRLIAGLERLYAARRLLAAGQGSQDELRAAFGALGVDWGEDSAAAKAEEELERRLGAPSTRLAAYGSLRPGELHHDLVGQLPGKWWPATTTGRIGESEGYPVLHWDVRGPLVNLMVLESNELLSHWAELDAFEGEGYLRSLLPVETGEGRLVVASCYLAA